MMKAFQILAAGRKFRGTPFDIFGYTQERREERLLLAEYEADLDRIEAALHANTLEAAVALASVPALIRGYGHVKAESMARAKGERARLLDRLGNHTTALQVANAAA